jgi:peptidyl-prolyl cis-trans isomerase C
VAARLAFAEADRLGIRLRPEVVEAETVAQIARFKADVAAEAPGVAVDDYLRGALGVEPETQWQSLREGVVRQMIAERAVRAFALERENASVRLIVVQTEEQAKALADRLTAGEEFGALARAESVDESAEQEGLVPFLVRQASSPLARVVFAAQPGEVVGPLPAAGHQFLVRVEELRPAIEGGWPALERPVEDSLRRFPVQESEFLHWKLELERSHPVDLAPLLERIGAAREPAPRPAGDAGPAAPPPSDP